METHRNDAIIEDTVISNDSSDGSCLGRMRLQPTAANSKNTEMPAERLHQPSQQGITSVPQENQLIHHLNLLKLRKNSEKFLQFQADLKGIDLERPYKNDNQKRGYCLLLNHKEFSEATGQSRRDGTDVDADSVELIFTALGFDVNRFNDLSTADLFGVLRYYARKDHSACDMFVMVVLSHGTEGRVFVRDGLINIDAHLVNPFRGANCKSLIGKPKLFFIQACRGSKCDPGITVPDSSERIPSEADILMFHSTAPGYFSWRNSHDGSWFIQALCYVLQNYVIDYDASSGVPPKSLDELITLTKQIVAVKFESNSSREDRSHMKEMPVVVSTLRKAFFFNVTKSPQK